MPRSHEHVSRRVFLAGSSAAAAMSVADEETLAAEPEDRPAPAGIVDCQSHLFAPELLAYMERRKEPPYIYSKDGQRLLVVGNWHRPMVSGIDLDAKLAAKDAAGIELTALSTNDPGPEQFGPDGAAVARMIHDFLADVVRRHPTRFIALATLPLQDRAAAEAELDRCVAKLGMRGILLYSNIAGRFPDEPDFRWLFAAAEAAGLPVLLHPPYPVCYEQTKGFNLTGGLGLMFDTTIALARIILSGILDEHPGLKLVCPHVGGTLPYLIGRIDHQVTVLRRVKLTIKQRPSDYLRAIYLDAVNALPAVIRFGIDLVGPERMLYSSDHPWVSPKLIIDNIRSLKLPAEQEQAVFRDNARKLFGLDR
jgi:predicted TIM-barrel fold metal-dependent hydrolase